MIHNVWKTARTYFFLWILSKHIYFHSRTSGFIIYLTMIKKTFRTHSQGCPFELKKNKTIICYILVYKSKNYFDQTLNIFFFHSALIPTISTHFEKKTHIFFKVRWPCPKIYALWTFFFKVRCNKPQHHINSLLFITVNNICTKLNR